MSTKKRRRGHGEGSIFQRQDGKWVAMVDHGWIDGKRKRTTRVRPTRREAANALRELLDQADIGVITDSRTTVATWMTTWLDEIEVRPNTRVMYQRTIDNYLVPAVGRRRLDKLTTDDVRNMMRDLRDKGRAASTIRHAKSILQRALAVAVAEGNLARNVAQLVKAPSPANNPHRVLSVTEVSAVLRAASTDTRLRCRLICAMVLGLRQGEALGLTWADIEILGNVGVLHIRRSAQRRTGAGMVVAPLKTERSQRDIELPPLAVAAFEAWRRDSPGRGYVFHGYRGPDVIDGAERDHAAWESALKLAGVKDAPLHGARGSAATVLQSLGVPDRVIADILGHSRVTTSQAHYLHSDETQRLDALTRMGAALEQEAARAVAEIEPRAVPPVAS